MKIGRHSIAKLVSGANDAPAPRRSDPMERSPADQFRPSSPGRGGLSLDGSGAPGAKIVPVAGRRYPVTTLFEGAAHSFGVEFGPNLAGHLAREGFSVDLTTGELVGKDGARFDLFGPARQEFQRQTGKDARWLVRDAANDLVGPPKKVLVLELQEGHVTGTSEGGVLSRLRCFRDLPSWGKAELYPESAYTPVQASELGRTPLTIAEGVQVFAPSTKLAERARELFESVCRHAMGQPGQRRETLAASLPKVNGLLEQLNAGGWRNEAREAQVNAAIREAKVLCAPQDASTWTEGDARAALYAKQAEAETAGQPIEIHIVPKGKHWTAMPALAPLREEVDADPVNRLSDACWMPTPDRQLVFIPEESLDGTASTIAARHELHHVLENLYLTDEQRAVVDRIHAETLRSGGPFARTYGIQRKEFWTTMAELFEGGEGPEGILWLKENQRELYELLCDATGRRPA